MADDQQIVQAWAEINRIKDRLAKIEADNARTGVINDRVIDEIVPAVKGLTDGIARLYTKVSTQGIKLALICSVGAAVGATAVSFLVQSLMR